jgi:protein-L-isoaspartate O-methyltransferase
MQTTCKIQNMNLYLEEQVLQIIANLNREHFVTPEELLEEMGYTPIVLSSGESLKDKLFTLANEFAVAGYGKTAVILHTIHNGLGNNEQEGGNK